nr:DDE-type integrase/transposase/recombinase [Candidatus Paracaedibacter acanthamoebae]
MNFLLRARRDAIAARAFFRKAFRENGRPDKVAIDKSGSNKSALDSFNSHAPREEQIKIRQSKYLNNIVEQDHRFIKKRTRPTLGFKNFYSAKATITGIEVVRMIQKGQVTGQHVCQSSFNNFAALMAWCVQNQGNAIKNITSPHRCDRAYFSTPSFFLLSHGF